MTVAAASTAPAPSGAAAPLVRMGAVVLGLHLFGGILLLTSVGPAVASRGSGPVVGVSVGITAYLLGMRHAFDVDHIAAIDSTTRKLLGDRIRTRSVGFWFSLGHSSVVVLLCTALAAGARVAGSLLTPADSGVRHTLALLGTTVSGAFLCGLGVLNLGLLIRLLPALRHQDERTAGATEPKGALALVLRPLMRTVTRPWQMYLVGLLFGLGFDTASEVALLVVAGGTAMAAVPWYAVLSLPILFAAGMSLLDTLDGWFMSVAYGWTFSHPRRRLLYNCSLTALSAAVALTIGAIELSSLAANGNSSGIDLGNVGYGVVGVFVIVWLASAYIARPRPGRDHRAPARS